MAPAAQKSTEITRADLDSITTLAELEALAASLNIDPGDETESIVGLPVLSADEKAKLVDVPFYLVSWEFHESAKYRNDDGTPAVFVSAVIMDRNSKKAILNDGSTGIRAQLQKLTAERTEKGHPTPKGLRKVSGGLRVSRYETDNGEAETFYLVG